MRKLFQSVRSSRIPQVIGKCASDTPALIQYVGAATEQLIIAGGETGWWGTWDKFAWNIECTSPYIVAPPYVARIINLDVCNHPIKIQNGFFELMENGIGYQERANTSCPSKGCALQQAYDRGTQPFITDFVAGNTFRAYPSSVADVGQRIFIAGTDTNGLPVSSLDNGSVVPGIFLTLEMPYAETTLAFNTITNVTKDLTQALVSVYQVTPSGAASLLANYQPYDVYPAYRKYFVAGVPNNCCGNPTPGIVQLHGMAKRDFLGYTGDMDELLISNLEALTAMCQAIRCSEMDSGAMAQKEQLYRRTATQILQRELDHYLGKERPAVVFAPLGSATRSYSAIGNMT